MARVNLGRAVSAGFKCFAETGVYAAPGGSPSYAGLNVILDRDEMDDVRLLQAGIRRAVARLPKALIFEVERAALAAPAIGGTVTLSTGEFAGIAFTVAEVPELDDTGAVWRLTMKGA